MNLRKPKYQISLSKKKNTYSIYYSYDSGQTWELHKTGFKSFDSAYREVTSLEGCHKLLADLKTK